MFLGIRKKYWLYLVVTVLLAGLVCFARLSPVFAWQRTTVSGPGSEHLNQWENEYNDGKTNLFRLDKRKFLEKCLTLKEIDNVRVRVKLPDGLDISTNSFEPVALIKMKDIYALDENCRVISYDTSWADVNLPLFTGVDGIRLFEIPDDYRVNEVVSALLMVRNDLPELYRQIAEIDFTDSAEISLYLTTCLSQFVATADGFGRQVVKLKAIGGLDNWSDGGRYNLQYDGVIIKER